MIISGFWCPRRPATPFSWVWLLTLALNSLWSLPISAPSPSHAKWIVREIQHEYRSQPRNRTVDSGFGSTAWRLMPRTYEATSTSAAYCTVLFTVYAYLCRKTPRGHAQSMIILRPPSPPFRLPCSPTLLPRSAYPAYPPFTGRHCALGDKCSRCDCASGKEGLA